jgi:hypothetical protein
MSEEPKADPFPVAFWFILMPVLVATFVIIAGWAR